MNKTVLRYFFDFIHSQEEWLNNMAKKGYRLKKCGKIAYSFEQCNPNEYEYAVEFVGTQSYPKVKLYREYLESMGYRTFTKNINFNVSFGKVKWRPYAKGMGQVATSPGSYDKELLILEKKKDGKPFELHTDVSDKLSAFKEVRRTYFWAMLVMIGLMVMTFVPSVNSMSENMIWAARSLLAVIFALFIIPAIKYSMLVKRLREESKTYE